MHSSTKFHRRVAYIRCYIYAFKKYSEKIDIAQKIKFSFKDFFSKCDQIRRNLGIATDLIVNIWNPQVRESFCILVISSKQSPSRT